MIAGKTLLESRDGAITLDYIRHRLRECDLNSGDTVMVSARLPFLGRLAPGNSLADVSKAIIEAVEDVVGRNGTVAVPAYSYAFCRQAQFDVRETPSTLGIFFETFRRRPGVRRSLDPIFSVCAKGPRAEFLTGGRCDDCFGDDSFSDRYHSLGDAKFLLVGLNYNYITNFHFVEQKFGVPYRFIKEFPGVLIAEDGVTTNRIQRYFVRDLNHEYDFQPFFRLLADRRIGRDAKFGNSILRMISDADFFDAIIELLEIDETFFRAKVGRERGANG